MAIQTPGCCDSEWQLLYKILQSLPDISTGGGGSDISVSDEGVLLTSGVTSFDFVGAGVTATAVGNAVTVTIAGGGAGTLQSGSQDIGSGVDTISVVFPVAYAAAPVVVATMSRPAAENLIELNIDQASITVAGFTASLSSTTASANYKIKWMAN